MKHFYSSLLILSLLTASTVSIVQNPNKVDAADTYPPEFVRDYSQECLQTSMEEGLQEAEAERLCQCTIDEFQKQYTLKEFKQLTAASITDETAENTLIEVGQGCFEQLLYEE